MKLIDIFDKETECDYRNEHYSLRDNGAIMRHAKEGKRPRPLDGVWTFGILDAQKGYTRILNAPGKEIEISRLRKHLELRDAIDIRKAIECFKNPNLW